MAAAAYRAIRRELSGGGSLFRYLPASRGKVQGKEIIWKLARYRTGSRAFEPSPPCQAFYVLLAKETREEETRWDREEVGRSNFNRRISAT